MLLLNCPVCGGRSAFGEYPSAGACEEGCHGDAKVVHRHHTVTCGTGASDRGTVSGRRHGERQQATCSMSGWRPHNKNFCHRPGPTRERTHARTHRRHRAKRACQQAQRRPDSQPRLIAGHAAALPRQSARPGQHTRGTTSPLARPPPPRPWRRECLRPLPPPAATGSHDRRAVRASTSKEAPAGGGGGGENVWLRILNCQDMYSSRSETYITSAAFTLQRLGR